jgi:PPOX class probable F420-dependent enzyme
MSDEPELKNLKKADPRLSSGAARNVWFGSVRADGRPHLVPIWFVWREGNVWVCMGKGTQKHVNVTRNPAVTLALEDGVKPVIVEGEARVEAEEAVRDRLAEAFIYKYDWDFRTDTDEDWLLVGVEPRKILMW